MSSPCGSPTNQSFVLADRYQISGGLYRASNKAKTFDGHVAWFPGRKVQQDRSVCKAVQHLSKDKGDIDLTTDWSTLLIVSLRSTQRWPGPPRFLLLSWGSRHVWSTDIDGKQAPGHKSRVLGTACSYLSTCVCQTSDKRVCEGGRSTTPPPGSRRPPSMLPGFLQTRREVYSRSQWSPFASVHPRFGKKSSQEGY